MVFNLPDSGVLYVVGPYPIHNFLLDRPNVPRLKLEFQGARVFKQTANRPLPHLLESGMVLVRIRRVVLIRRQLKASLVLVYPPARTALTGALLSRGLGDQLSNGISQADTSLFLYRHNTNH